MFLPGAHPQGEPFVVDPAARAEGAHQLLGLDRRRIEPEAVHPLLHARLLGPALQRSGTTAVVLAPVGYAEHFTLDPLGLGAGDPYYGSYR